MCIIYLFTNGLSATSMIGRSVKSHFQSVIEPFNSFHLKRFQKLHIIPRTLESDSQKHANMERNHPRNQTVYIKKKKIINLKLDVIHVSRLAKKRILYKSGINICINYLYWLPQANSLS